MTKPLWGCLKRRANRSKSRAKYKVAQNTEQAIASLSERADLPALIVLDFDDRKPDGLNLITAVRECHATRRIPVIVLGRHPDQESVNRAYESGANAYIHKPIDNLVDVIGDIDRFWLRRAELPVHPL